MFSSGVTELIDNVTYKNSDVAIQKIMIKKVLGNSRKEARNMLKSDGSGEYAASEL